MSEKIESGYTQTIFEKIRQVDESGHEFWSARQLLKVLDYVEFRNFMPVIERAKEACVNSGQDIRNHFVDCNEMVDIGSGAQREMASVRLSRYACYLIVQNADPGKEVVALGQTYFAVQTRLSEIRKMDGYARLGTEEEKRLFLRDEMKKHNLQLARVAKESGVIEPADYAIFQNHGYKGLYGGLDAGGMRKHRGLAKGQNILDHMGSTELAANLFRATQTEEKLKKEKVDSKTKANQTHYEVGKKVRKIIHEIGGAMPENLPTAVDIKKIEGARKQNN